MSALRHYGNAFAGVFGLVDQFRPALSHLRWFQGFALRRGGWVVDSHGGCVDLLDAGGERQCWDFSTNSYVGLLVSATLDVGGFRMDCIIPLPPFSMPNMQTQALCAQSRPLM